MAEKEKSLTEIVVNFFVYGTFLWVLGIFGMIFFLETNEFILEYYFYLAVIPLIGVIVIPLMYPLLREQSTQKLVEVAKNYEPIIHDEFTVNNADMKTVYYRGLKWLESKGAVIYEANDEDYLFAYHEVYDKVEGADGIGVPTSNKPLNLPKFFRLRLIQDGDVVKVELDILSGWHQVWFDGTKRRKEAWRLLMHQCRYHLQS